MTNPQFDPNAGQYNPDPTQYGQAPGDFGQAPGSYGQAPGQFGQGPPGTGPGYGMPNMGYQQQGMPLAVVARKRGMRQVIIGASIFAVGLVITITTYSHAATSSTGGTYFVAYGPMILGAITIVRGIVAVMRSNRLG